MKDEGLSWDPTAPNQWVRLRQNPGKAGLTTGKTKKIGSGLKVQIQWGPNDVDHRNFDLLELCPAGREPLEEFTAGSFGSHIDLRKLLTLEKIHGRLTNVFYSMESSNTDFYAHQFKPVLKFIESPIGRLLIADQVGLGKTIEAGYIWKELKAREDARRLLIVVPAHLRDKWREDLLMKFSIDAHIVDAKDLLQTLRNFLESGKPSEFVCICSIQGLRPPRDFSDESVVGPRAELARILDSNATSDVDSLFDLVVIDEAHYMRNLGTLTNLLGQLLRDSSRHSLLLTATPYQTSSTNLFNLLRLVNPEDFFNERVFDEIMEANKPVIEALRCLWNVPPEFENAKTAVERALTSPYFQSNASLQRVLDRLNADPPKDDRMQRIKLGYSLESASLLGHYMSRSRKRDVPECQVKRGAQTLVVQFSDLEKEIYEFVTKHVREKAGDLRGIQLFSVIARQTQMASCMVAALRSWTKKGFLDEVLDEGLGLSGWTLENEEEPKALGDTEWPFADGYVDYEKLEREDTKYKTFIDFLNSALERNPSEKFVVFSFFRGTLHYLERRLGQDGVSACTIMGGMGDEKSKILKRFKEEEGLNVLLSSEVGSEGIDLQFCRILVNYDLPWNPMKVEQRIGRLDRLGQKAERITIVNLSLIDTVEGRILDRLYERINLFEESIGDMEEILGEMTEQILTELFEPSLSGEERELKAEEIADAIMMRGAQQERLETEAINLVAFSDYVLESINETRNTGRWLRPKEVMNLVQDFLRSKYSGTDIQASEKFDGALRIKLSPDAKTNLGFTANQLGISAGTILHKVNDYVECLFDPKQVEALGRNIELVDPTHPLIRWIRKDHEESSETLQRTAAIKLSASNVNTPPGIYGFSVHKWSFDGLRSERKLVFAAKKEDGTGDLNELDSEALVNAATLKGKAWTNAWNLIPDRGGILDVIESIEEELLEKFTEEERTFKEDNDDRCDVQQTSAERFANRRIKMFQDRIKDFEAAGKTKPIPMTVGLLDKEENELGIKQRTIEDHRVVDARPETLCMGMISVE